MATSFSDYSNPYITEMYEQKKQAAADALTAAYQQTMADYDAQARETSQSYARQKNQTQAQYEQALRSYGEYAGASGLNSGAKAQARLAYGAQNQSGLSNLSVGEAAALQEIARSRAGTQRQYQADLAENAAAYDTDFYNALYSAWQDQVSQENADRDYYYKLAMNSIQTGSVPDANTLAMAGIDSGTAATMAAYYQALMAGTSSGGGSSRSSGGNSGGSAVSGGLSGLSGQTAASAAGTTWSGSNTSDYLAAGAQYASHLIGPGAPVGTTTGRQATTRNTGGVTASNSMPKPYATVRTL